MVVRSWRVIIKVFDHGNKILSQRYEPCRTLTKRFDNEPDEKVVAEMVEKEFFEMKKSSPDGHWYVEGHKESYWHNLMDPKFVPA